MERAQDITIGAMDSFQGINWGCKSVKSLEEMSAEAVAKGAKNPGTVLGHRRFDSKVNGNCVKKMFFVTPFTVIHNDILILHSGKDHFQTNANPGYFDKFSTKDLSPVLFQYNNAKTGHLFLYSRHCPVSSPEGNFQQNYILSQRKFFKSNNSQKIPPNYSLTKNSYTKRSSCAS